MGYYGSVPETVYPYLRISRAECAHIVEMSPEEMRKPHLHERCEWLSVLLSRRPGFLDPDGEAERSRLECQRCC